MLFAVMVESFAQLFLKFGATRQRGWVLLGIVAYVVEIALYTVALHYLDVSVAFPLGSLCFVGVALLSRFFLAEKVGRLRWLGVACIVIGTVLVVL
jgi:undecaprenyl phosphate-alpha-L-ara4N flippase subunit ArnE